MSTFGSGELSHIYSPQSLLAILRNMSRAIYCYSSTSYGTYVRRSIGAMANHYTLIPMPCSSSATFLSTLSETYFSVRHSACCPESMTRPGRGTIRRSTEACSRHRYTRSPGRGQCSAGILSEPQKIRAVVAGSFLPAGLGSGEPYDRDRDRSHKEENGARRKCEEHTVRHARDAAGEYR